MKTVKCVHLRNSANPGIRNMKKITVGHIHFNEII